MEQKTSFFFFLSCIKRSHKFEISININCYSQKQIINRNIPHMKKTTIVNLIPMVTKRRKEKKSKQKILWLNKYITLKKSVNQKMNQSTSKLGKCYYYRAKIH